MSRKVAFITGGEGGIGLAIGRLLVSQGFRVVSADISVAEDFDQKPHDDEPELLRSYVDVTDEESVNTAIHYASAQGQLQALVNCAGIVRSSTAENPDVKSGALMWDINVMSMSRTIAAALPHLSPGSSIVNISSISGRMGKLGEISIYGATKAAMEAYTRHLAFELGPRGIRVNCVAPGFIEVLPMSDAMRSAVDNPKSMVNFIPLGKMGTAEQVAPAVGFLISEAADYITGTTVVVDGGVSAL